MFSNVSQFHGVHFVFLDRDGVINRKAIEGKYIADWSEFEILPGVEDAIENLNRQGIRVLVTSNQRGIALGVCTVEGVEEIHRRLQEHLKSQGAHVDRFYYCPHDRGECNCRKPAIGLFQLAIRDFPTLNAETSVMIGDSLSDIEAARNFCCRSILIAGDPTTRKQGYREAIKLADAAASTLDEAVRMISCD